MGHYQPDKKTPDHPGDSISLVSFRFSKRGYELVFESRYQREESSASLLGRRRGEKFSVHRDSTVADALSGCSSAFFPVHTMKKLFYHVFSQAVCVFLFPVLSNLTPLCVPSLLRIAHFAHVIHLKKVLNILSRLTPQADPKERYSVNELLADLAGCRATRVLLFVDQSYSGVLSKRLRGSQKHLNVVLIQSQARQTHTHQNQRLNPGWEDSSWSLISPATCLLDQLGKVTFPSQAFHVSLFQTIF